MRDDDRFEYPPPVLSVDADVLSIETQESFSGRIRIKNTGGGLLSGVLLSRSRAVVFEPSSWEGNDISVAYRFTPGDADGLKPGGELESCVYISSNGGEKKLPIRVKLIKMAIPTPEGPVIANIHDFFNYAQTHPAQARRMFTGSEFYMLLLATGYEYMEAYEMLHKDANRERALDNFFILSGLKKKTALSLPAQRLEFKRGLADTTVLHGHFLAQKSDGGFFEAKVSAQRGAPWLTLYTDRLLTSDFNEGNTAVVNFSIDPARIPTRYASENVIIGAEMAEDEHNAVELVFKRPLPLTMKLDREAYKYDDHGVVQVYNQTGQDLTVALFCGENFVRFDALKYRVGEFYEIPFTIKLGGFLSAQMLFRKLPFLRAAIEVTAQCGGQPIKRVLPLVAGKW